MVGTPPAIEILESMTEPDALLDLRGLGKRYGEVVALAG
jgi:hypothetical protein